MDEDFSTVAKVFADASRLMVMALSNHLLDVDRERHAKLMAATERGAAISLSTVADLLGNERILLEIVDANGKRHLVFMWERGRKGGRNN